jgi:HSP20 family molecular chaperone IbpA
MNPYAIYRRPDYQVTYVDETFPDHHWPFEHMRHTVRHAMHDVFNPYVNEFAHSPRADIHETVKKFYIDVELAGLRSKDDLTLAWINTNTLLLKANIHRSDIHPDEGMEKDEKETEIAGDAGERGKEFPKGAIVHALVKERHVGKVARSFAFSVDINAETMKAHVLNGVLHIILEKMPHEQVQPKVVTVEHS